VRLLLLLTLALSIDAQVTVRGRIIDADGKPVANASVQVGLANDASFESINRQNMQTTGDGRYAISFSEEPASLVVSLPGHAVVRSKTFVMGNVDSHIDVVLPRFLDVPLRVMDIDGKPVKDALVSFATSDEAAELPTAAHLLSPSLESRMVRTDDKGEVLLHLVPSLWAFGAKASGYRETIIREQAIKAGSSVAMTLDKAFAIRGRVHRKGIGVASARIRLFVAGRNSRSEYVASTDEDGAFEVRDLEAGTYTLGILKEDELLSHTVEAKAPSTTDIELPPAGTLRLRFVDALTQEPVRQFNYSIATLEAGEGFSTPPEGLTAEAEDGAISFTVSPGRYRVSGRSRDHTESEPIEVRVDDREPAEVTIRLDRGITISGRVADESNEPIPGAQVAIDAVMRVRRRVGFHSTETAKNGSFRLMGLDPGNVGVTVSKEGFASSVQALEIDRDTEIDVQLGHGLTIEGIVRRAGEPVADAEIQAATNGGADQKAVTDASGRFVLRGLTNSRYTVSATSTGAHTEIRNVDPTKARELVLSFDPKPTGTVFGVVSGMPTSTRGNVLRIVFALSTDPDGNETHSVIDDAGNYRLKNVPLGETFISARIESPILRRASRRRKVEVVAGQPLRVDLDFGGGITVRGRITEHGKPVEGADIRFENSEGVAGGASSRPDGSYETVLPASGLYNVFAYSSAGDGTMNAQLVRVIHGDDVVDIDMRQFLIEGTVVDAKTRVPMSGVIVLIASVLNPRQQLADDLRTDMNGRFSTLAGASGPHRVIATAPGYAQATQTIQLGGPAPAPLLFELTKTESLLVRILDAKNGNPLGAIIDVETRDGAYLAIRCTPIGGVAYDCSLAPGKYRLRIDAWGYAVREVEVTAPGSVEVELQ
jgi:protocatechuate 3,4-dioxygenase beta subunit